MTRYSGLFLQIALLRQFNRAAGEFPRFLPLAGKRCSAGLPIQVIVFTRPRAGPIHLFLHRGCVPADKSEPIEVTVNTNGVEFLRNHLLARYPGLFKAIEPQETKCQVRPRNAQGWVKTKSFAVFFDGLLVPPN